MTVHGNALLMQNLLDMGIAFDRRRLVQAIPVHRFGAAIGNQLSQRGECFALGEMQPGVVAVQTRLQRCQRMMQPPAAGRAR